jgi:hypothetical protein
MLKEVYPDYTDLVWKFGREHHHVNYLPFKDTPLKRKPEVVIPDGINNYGLSMVEISPETPGRV